MCKVKNKDKFEMKNKIIVYIILASCFIIFTAGCITSTTQDDLVAPAEDRQLFDEQPEIKEEELMRDEGNASAATLLYQGHGSLRITTPEGKVIYIDPYAGEGYDVPADLILITHPHQDHTKIELIETQNPNSLIITHEEALVDGEHKTFKFDYVTVEAVEAGNNPNHDINICVGYIVTLSDGVSIYISGDTSKTEQMARLAERELDYAFFCSDGRYNMDMDEAAECATLVSAKHSIPYHMSPGQNFNRERAELFEVENRLIIADGEEITLTSE